MKGAPAQEEYDTVAGDDASAQRRRDGIVSAFPEDMHLVSLKEALEHAEIPDAGKIAKLCAENARKINPSAVEVLSYVFAYTMEIGKDYNFGDNPYYRINQAMLKGTSLALFPVRDLIWGLFMGLRTLHYKKFDVLYRGLKTRTSWAVGETRRWPSFSSTAKNRDKAQSFLAVDASGDYFGTMVEIHDAWGYDLEKVTMVNGEKEVLVEPGIEILVESSVPGSVVFVTVSVIEESGDLLLDRIPRLLEAGESQDTETDMEYEKAVGLMKEDRYEEAVPILDKLSKKGHFKSMSAMELCFFGTTTSLATQRRVLIFWRRQRIMLMDMHSTSLHVAMRTELA